jgi:hypothetical protein
LAPRQPAKEYRDAITGECANLGSSSSMAGKGQRRFPYGSVAPPGEPALASHRWTRDCQRILARRAATSCVDPIGFPDSHYDLSHHGDINTDARDKLMQMNQAHCSGSLPGLAV